MIEETDPGMLRHTAWPNVREVTKAEMAQLGELINGLPLCEHRSTEIDHNGRTLCRDCGDVLAIPEKKGT